MQLLILEKKIWPLPGESKFILYLELNYSSLEKEVWPLSGESKVHSLAQTQLHNPRERGLAIICGIKISFFFCKTTTLGKEVWPFSWESEVHFLPLTQQLNSSILKVHFLPQMQLLNTKKEIWPLAGKSKVQTLL